MTPQTTQERIVRWMGMRKARNGPLWFKSVQTNETCRLPNLTTEAGVALWCAWIEAELQRRGVAFCINWLPHLDGRGWRARLIHGPHSIWQIERDGPTKLAALEAAVLKLMESER